MKGTGGNDMATNNLTDDQQKQAETGEELSERELEHVVGGAVDAFLQFTQTNAPSSETEEKP
jgi:bacteriocin-like protein